MCLALTPRLMDLLVIKLSYMLFTVHTWAYKYVIWMFNLIHRHLLWLYYSAKIFAGLFILMPLPINRNNMGSSPDQWDNRMVDHLKNFDLSSPEVRQQFGEWIKHFPCDMVIIVILCCTFLSQADNLWAGMMPCWESCVHLII